MTTMARLSVEFLSQPAWASVYFRYLSAGWGHGFPADESPLRLEFMILLPARRAEWRGPLVSQFDVLVARPVELTFKRKGLTANLWICSSAAMPDRVVGMPLPAFLNACRPLFLDVSRSTAEALRTPSQRLPADVRATWEKVALDVEAFVTEASSRGEEDFGNWLVSRHGEQQKAFAAEANELVTEMPQDDFWRIVESFGGNPTSARSTMRELPAGDLRGFAVRLQHVLWELDTPAVASAVYGRPTIPSADDFLYARCAIVLLGKSAATSAAEGHDTRTAGRAEWFLNLADMEFERRFGRSADVDGRWSTDSGSNPAWTAFASGAAKARELT